MSEFTTAWTCPECGIDVTSGRHYQLDCLAHQLAQRDERNAALEARVLRLERGLREIETLVPEPYQFPVDWDEQVASCADCRRFANHPIQQGICDTHRRPLWARDRHDANEEARLGYRAMKLARKVLEEAGHE